MLFRICVGSEDRFNINSKPCTASKWSPGWPLGSMHFTNHLPHFIQTSRTWASGHGVHSHAPQLHWLPNYPPRKKNGELPNFLMVRIKNHAFMLRLCSIPNSQIFHASASRDASKSGGEPVGPREFNKAKLMVVAMICALQWQSARSQRSNAWDTVPGQSQRKPHFSLGGYPLVIKHSYWKSPFIVDFPIKNGDFP